MTVTLERLPRTIGVGSAALARGGAHGPLTSHAAPRCGARYRLDAHESKRPAAPSRATSGYAWATDGARIASGNEASAPLPVVLRWAKKPIAS